MSEETAIQAAGTPQDLDALFDALQVEDQAVKVYFTVEGYRFWFKRQQGMVRLRRIALKLLEAQEDDPIGLEEGKYDKLIQTLLSRVVYQPAGEGELVELNPEGYKSFLMSVEAYDEFIAIAVDMQLPFSVAAVCLGKQLLAKAMSDAQANTTSSDSGENSAPKDVSLSDGQTSPTTTSAKPAPVFQGETATTG